MRSRRRPDHLPIEDSQLLCRALLALNGRCSDRRLAISFGSAIKDKRFSEYQLHPRWIGIRSAPVVVDDGANRSSKDDVTGKPGVSSGDCPRHCVMVPRVLASNVHVFVGAMYQSGIAGFCSNASMVVSERAFRTIDGMTSGSPCLDLYRLCGVIDNRRTTGECKCRKDNGELLKHVMNSMQHAVGKWMK